MLKNVGVKKILIVFGTRPEAIKMAPLVKELRSRTNFEIIVAVTGQHREMLDQVLELFQIKPEFDLRVMQPRQDLFDITGKVLIGMREILTTTKPVCVLVHGDTTTSLATSLAAYYQQVPVGHVEAGLRTYNIYSPWPEEMNRQLTGRIASFHFSPTEASKKNLLSEGVTENRIFVTGNTVIDALQFIVKQLSSSEALNTQLLGFFQNIGIKVSEYPNKKMVLITGHRRENFGEGFLQICRAIRSLSVHNPDVDFIYPVHLNPNVQAPVKQILDQPGTANIFLIEPLDYLPFVYLMARSYLLLTDSGGIQEEGPGLGKPVLVMRNTTERPEAIDAGTVKLVGTDESKIFTSVNTLLTDPKAYNEMASSVNPYGDGLAARRIADILTEQIPEIFKP
jgi:UDP-N-acetylglucosamine 2-epimerase (non-hydrolysing)